MIQYLIEGIQHITDLEGYDHMLFLAALCAPFSIKDWRPVVLLATAFTLGHSISLMVAAADLIRFSSTLIETLIPLTIMITASIAIVQYKKSTVDLGLSRYLVTLIFGVIHGLGFSTYFRMISDDTGSFIKSLLFFNLGVEIGQLMIVLIFLAVSYVFVRFIKLISQNYFTLITSILVFLVACYLFAEKLIEA